MQAHRQPFSGCSSFQRWSSSNPASLALAGLVALAGCGSVTGGEQPGADAGADPDAQVASQLVGSFSVTSVEGTSDYGAFVLPSDTRWLRFGVDGTYDLYTESPLGFRTTAHGLFQATETQLLMTVAIGVVVLFNYEVDGDTLTLSSPSLTLAAALDDAMPAADEWVVPASIDDRVVLGPRSQELEATDLAWDGTYLWYGNAYTNRRQLVRYNFDAQTEVSALSVNVYAWGLAWDGANLWGSSNGYDTIHKIDMATGNTVMTSTTLGAWMPGIAWNGTHLWAYSQNEGTLYEYDPAGNTVVRALEIGSVGIEGMEVAGGSLFAGIGDTIQKLSMGDDVRATQTFRLPGVRITGLAHDGTSFYVMGTEGEDVVLLRVTLPGL